MYGEIDEFIPQYTQFKTSVQLYISMDLSQILWIVLAIHRKFGSVKSKSDHIDHEQIKNDAQLLYLYFFNFQTWTSKNIIKILSHEWNKFHIHQQSI
jgi:hypothetical protein